mgnify:CR=1 FL=1
MTRASDSGALVREPVLGHRIWIRESGDPRARPVLLVHGVGDRASRDFDPLVERLAERHRPIAFDLPGFGRSDRRNEHYTPDRYAELLRWIADERAGGPVDLVAHSLGGAVALLFAGLHPHRVGRLALADVAGVLHRQAYAEHMVYLGVDRVPLVDGGLGGRVQRLLHYWVRPLTRLEPDPSLLFELESARERLLGGDPAKIAGVSLILKNLGPAIDAVRARTLLVWGADDRIAPLRTGRLLADRIPGARLEVIDGAAHVPMTQTPERFYALLDAFLDGPAAPEPPPARPPLASERVGRCRGEAACTFRGEHARVEISGCPAARLEGVRARELVVESSDVTLESCEIDSGATAVRVTDSRLRATGGSITGEVAIEAEASDLDLAGTVVAGRRFAARAGGERKSDALFSVCPVVSPLRRGHLHGIYRLVPGKEL